MSGDAEAIRELIAALDGEDTTAAEDAQTSLESFGAEVLDPLMSAVPEFGPFGQLCAIELFQHIGEPRAGAVLIPMLRSEEDTVREWSAQALASLGVVEAVPDLRRAYAATKRRATPPDWTEPESIRIALTELGDREEVVPARVAHLARSEGDLGRCWAVKDLAEVIACLADAGQLILYFQYWERWRGSHTWKDTPGWELDWSLPWPELVASARTAALEAARAAGTPRKTFATVSWMAEADR